MDEMHPCLTHQIVLKIYQRRGDYALAEVEELMHNRFHSGDCYMPQRRVNTPKHVYVFDTSRCSNWRKYTRWAREAHLPSELRDES